MAGTVKAFYNNHSPSLPLQNEYECFYLLKGKLRFRDPKYHSRSLTGHKKQSCKLGQQQSRNILSITQHCILRQDVWLLLPCPNTCCDLSNLTSHRETHPEKVLQVGLPQPWKTLQHDCTSTQIPSERGRPSGPLKHISTF